MQRRKFLNIGMLTVAIATVSVTNLTALNFRESNIKAWDVAKSPDAIRTMFGDGKLISTDRIKMIAPKLAENGGSIPITLKSDLDIETIAFFQDANPRSTTVVFSVPEGQKVNYSFRIKMRQSADVTVVAKAKDGTLYTLRKEIDVSIGGCGGS